MTSPRTYKKANKQISSYWTLLRLLTKSTIAYSYTNCSTFAMRQSSGTTPVSSDFWNINCSSGEISVASSFRILGDMLSGPGALYGFNFQKSLDTGVVPDDWRIANVSPVYKKGQKTLAENSTNSMSCVSQEWPFRNPCCSGYRMLFSSPCFMILLANICSIVLQQGSVLGPGLFLYYINDLQSRLTSTVRLFADDTIAYLTISNNNDAETGKTCPCHSPSDHWLQFSLSLSRNDVLS
jgi:hypothetical protein